MEAKDTVISNEQVIKLTQDIFRELTDGEIPVEHISVELVKPILEAQAEISFKAGIREVVEWIKAHAKDSRVKLITNFIPISEIDWQEKLREWGVE